MQKNKNKDKKKGMKVQNKQWDQQIVTTDNLVIAWAFVMSLFTETIISKGLDWDLYAILQKCKLYGSSGQVSLSFLFF